MLFPREGLLSHFGQPFNDTIRPSLPTIAEPAWFAPPIDVRQDRGGLTVVFQVTGHAESELRVEASGRNLFIWGPRLRAQADAERRAMRVFALPFDVSPHDVQTSRSRDLLRVRIAKKMDRVSPRPTAHTAQQGASRGLDTRYPMNIVRADPKTPASGPRLVACKP